MHIAFFDLDNTLLAGDSDVAWGQFVVDEGWVDAESHARQSSEFHAQYAAGTLDIHAFQRFTLAPLFGRPWSTLAAARERFVGDYIEPIIAPLASELVDRHVAAGHKTAIITATNRFIAEPIATRLGIDTLIATDPEYAAGSYTGEIVGTPAYREGKIARVDQWLNEQPGQAERTWFYSDSLNDLPLLRRVDMPVAVDPDTTLDAEARRAGWHVISLRTDSLPAIDAIPERTYCDQRAR
ncbi:histidinol-phosphatase [Salinisphaera orenii]|uniref:histidinol-phosphatase n=1 Tax=Salinisphaera orenii TaxID=856731 RepID=UPI000DBE3C95